MPDEVYDENGRDGRLTTGGTGTLGDDRMFLTRPARPERDDSPTPGGGNPRRAAETHAGAAGILDLPDDTKRPDMDVTDRPPTAVLFDLDGTLIDTWRLYLEAYRRALGPRLGRIPELHEFAVKRPSSEKHFLTGWLGPEDAAACHAEMNRHYEALHAVYCEGPYDGVREMLTALRSAGVPLGIVTGKGAHAWEVTRRTIDLGDFSVVVREEDVPEPKPHPAGLRAALSAMGLEASGAVYIGDSLSDMEAGRAAGMRIGVALWAKTDATDREAFLRDVERWAPDWLFERPADVTRLFAAWC